MDSDGEVMFCQLMREEAAFADEEENEMVMAALLEAMAVEAAEPKHGGSRRGRRANKNRQRATGHRLLWDDYFSDTPANTPQEFRRRFQMNRELFSRIVHGVWDYDEHFELKKTASGF